MISFEQFLLDKNAVPLQKLLNALIEQQQKIPSCAEIIYKKNLLSSENIWQAILYQSTHGVEFKTACVTLNLWTPLMEKAVREEWFKIRTPLYEILLQSGSIDHESLVKILDEYLSQESSEAAVAAPAIVLVQNGDGNSQLAKGFADFFDDRKKCELSAMITELKKEKFLELYKEFHSIRGSARLSNSNLSEHLIENMEEVLSTEKEINDEKFKFVKDLVQKSYNVLVCLRDCIEETGSEESFWNDTSLRKTYEEIIMDLLNYKKQFTPQEVVA